MSLLFIEVDDDYYQACAGCQHSLMREWGKAPTGAYFEGRWVLRNQWGEYVDHDQYRSDLFERNNITAIDKDVVDV